MTKDQAIELFGSARRLADALEVSPQAIYQWPAGELAQSKTDQVVGAAIRLGKMQVDAALKAGTAA